MNKMVMILSVVGVAAGCGRFQVDEAEEVGQTVGDVFASYDEAGQGAGLAWTPMYRRDLSRGTLLDRALDLAMPSAQAATCNAVRFAQCVSGTKSKDLAGCSFGGVDLAGTVELSFSQTDCSLGLAGDTVTRTADFTLTGRRGATLTVSSAGGGQQVTRTDTGWTYRVLGLHREMSGPLGKKLFDIDTRTTADIGVTGNSRANRVVSGGTLEIRHNLAKYTTTLSPSQLVWTATCNCPVSGELTGTVARDDGEVKDASLLVTGCGTATVTLGDESKDVVFDRCSGV